VPGQRGAVATDDGLCGGDHHRANAGLLSGGVASPPVQDRVPWRLIVQRTVNICARRCKARIIWRDEAPGG
jgi:hypothetical protein